MTLLSDWYCSIRPCIVASGFPTRCISIKANFIFLSLSFPEYNTLWLPDWKCPIPVHFSARTPSTAVFRHLISCSAVSSLPRCIHFMSQLCGAVKHLTFLCAHSGGVGNDAAGTCSLLFPRNWVFPNLGVSSVSLIITCLSHIPFRTVSL